MESKYPVSWLDCRYPFDKEARNTELQSRIDEYFKSKSEVHILDLGAGNGSNFKFWSERSDVPLRWTFLEMDPLLCKELSNLDSNVVVIEGEVGNLQNLLDLNTVDFVMANALFDLFSVDQFRELAELMKSYQIPFYFSLNYEGMDFHPRDSRDSLATHLYHQHMKRPQNFGKAMGESGPEQMLELLSEMKFTSISGSYSTWRVRNNHHTMLKYLLDFMDQAIHELKLPMEDLSEFENWLKLRRSQSERDELALEVLHKDILYLPD